MWEYLCFCLTANIKLLHSQWEWTSNLIPKTPRQAVTPWLQHLIKLIKLFFYSNSWLIYLNATECLTHSPNLKASCESKIRNNKIWSSRYINNTWNCYHLTILFADHYLQVIVRGGSKNSWSTQEIASCWHVPEAQLVG